MDNWEEYINRLVRELLLLVTKLFSSKLFKI